jgi:DNA-binding CsgD family transcriptional regulator
VRNAAGHDGVVRESTELVGREAESSTVQRWLSMVPAGRAGLVLRGEPGIGKTVLWSRAVEAARGAGSLVLLSRPVQAELPLGYAGLGDLFEQVASAVVEEIAEPLGQALAEALLLREATRTSDPHVVARATLAAFRVLSVRSPVVIAIDDAQWLDGASARALAFAARRLVDDAVSFALTVRDSHPDPVDCRGSFDERALELTVGGLSLGAMTHLLRTRVDPQTARRAVARIQEQSGGNPLYALELARSPASERLPSSLRALVAERLDAVEAAAAPALEQAAVMGPASIRSFPDGGSLEAAVTAGILTEERGRVRFAHPLLAAAAYDRIPGPRRRDLHRQAAARSPGVEERARHLALACESADPAAADLLEEAARLAASRGAPAEAAELVTHAVRLTAAEAAEDQLRRLADAADYLMLAGDEPAAGLIVQQILARQPRGPVRVRALVHGALLAADPRAAVEMLEAAVAEPLEDHLLAARALGQLAWQRGAWLGDVETALGEARRSVDLAQLAGDPSALCQALTTCGLLAAFVGDPGAEDCFHRALELTGAPRAAGAPSTRLAYANVLWWRGDWSGAEQLLDAERRAADSRGDEGLAMRLDIFGAGFEQRRGRWDDAERLLSTALGEARDYWRVMALVERGRLRAHRGEAGADEDAEEIGSSPSARADPVVAAAAEHIRGLVALDGGDVPAAAELMQRLPRAIDASGASAVEYAMVIPETVAVLVEAGRVSEARELADQLDRHVGPLGVHGSAGVLLCRGLVALAEGTSAEALDLLIGSRKAFDEIGAPWELGQALLAEGAALRRLGRRRDAAAAIERAVTIFGLLGAEPARRRATRELSRARPRPRRDDAPTDAERRVAMLVAQGLTNKEVAGRLFTTVATVEAHLTRLYGKLGIRSRTQLTRLVAEGHLDPPG